MEHDQTTHPDDPSESIQGQVSGTDDITIHDIIEIKENNLSVEEKLGSVKTKGEVKDLDNYDITIKALLDSLLCSIENENKEDIVTSHSGDCLNKQFNDSIENNSAESFVNFTHTRVNDESLMNQCVNTDLNKNEKCDELNNNNFEHSNTLSCADDFSKLKIDEKKLNLTESENDNEFSNLEISDLKNGNHINLIEDQLENNNINFKENNKTDKILTETKEFQETNKSILTELNETEIKSQEQVMSQSESTDSILDDNSYPSCNCMDIQNVIFPKSWVESRQNKKQRNYSVMSRQDSRKHDFVYCGLEKIIKPATKDKDISMTSCIKVETPKQAADIPQDILYSGVIEFPGTEDLEGYRLIILYSDPHLWQHYSIGCIALARFLLYTVSGLPKVLLLIDARTTDVVSSENILESLAIFKANLENLDFKILLLSEENESFEENISSIFQPKCCQIIRSLDELGNYFSKENLPNKFGGNFVFSNAEWIQNRLVVDAFVLFCENVQHNFERETLHMTSQSLPDNAMATRSLLVDHHDDMHRLLDDKQLQNLQNRGQRILQQLLEDSGTDARTCAEKVHSSYTSANQAVSQFVHVADERLLSLERHLLVKEFEQSCEKILKWSNSCSTKLDNFQVEDDSFELLKSQQENFEIFYYDVITQYAKCNSVLSDAEHLNDLGYLNQGLLLSQRSKLTKEEIRNLVEKMDAKKIEIETATQMYKFIDQAYSWALNGMKFVAMLNMDSCLTVDACSNMLEQFDIYMEQHPPIQQCEFNKMLEMAAKYNNIKCLRQCEFAQQKCSETSQLFFKRRDLLAKAKSQLKNHKKRSTFRMKNREKLDKNPRNDSAESSRRTSVLSEEFTSEGAISNDSAIGTMSSEETSDFNTTSESNFESRSSPLLHHNLTSQSSPTFQSPPLNHSVSLLSRHSRKILKKSVTMPTNQMTRTLNQSQSGTTLTIGSPVRREEIKDTSGKSKVDLAIEELIFTEREYVKSLNYVIENYFPEMCRLDIPEALRCKRNIIFGNLEKIHDFHSHFFLKDLEKCYGNPALVAKTFQAHRESFGLYALYSKNKPQSDILLFEHGNLFFKTKQIELGDKMDLASYLLKPVQRMGKYALLLHAMAKRSIGSEERSLRTAEDLVKFQLRHGNDLLTMDSIQDCDVNLKEQGNLLRQDEFVIYSGRRKLIRRVFLFEEMILFSKPIRVHGGHDVYQCKTSYKTAEIGMTENIGDSGFRFEIWFRRRRQQDTFVLQSSNKSIKWQWVEEIKGLLWKQALKNRDHRKHEMSSMGVGNKPHLDLVNSSPNTILNRSVLSNFARSRASVATTDFEQNSMFNSKRPHSAISTSSSASSGGSGGNLASALALAGFDSRPPMAYRTINEDTESIESSQNDDSSSQDINEDSQSNSSSHNAGQYVTSVGYDSLQVVSNIPS